jgi:hypothetical protein
MAILKYVLCAGWMITLSAGAAAKFDKKDTISGVKVESGKKDSTRLYRGTYSKTFPFSLESVKNSVVNFHEKCNNKFKDKRQFTDKKADCKYHNDNLVETIVVKDINQTGWNKAEGETERYVLGRQVYNRGAFGYYELVQVVESKNALNQKVLTVTQTMLNDKETKVYTKPKFDRDSAFDKTTATFVLTEVRPKETTLSYEYKAETEHWILNKEVSVPQVFASISKSINDLVKTVDKESQVQARDLASF